VLERRVVLEDEPHVASAGGVVGGVHAVDLDLAGVGRLQAGDDPQQRGLAAAARAEQRGEATGGDLHRDVVERDELPEAFGDVANRDAQRVLLSSGRMSDTTTMHTMAANASRNDVA
jgi:hypothetical protein